MGARARAARRVGAHGDVELDPIHTRVSQRVDLGFGARRSETTTEAGEARVQLAFLQHRPGEENARAGPRARLDGRAIRDDIVELAAEVEHGGDAGGQKELGVPLLRRVHVHVHVDEPGRKKPATAVDDRGARRNRRGRRRTDAGHAVRLDDDRYWRQRWTAGPVDQSGADNRQFWVLRHKLEP